ncbi:MAG: EamA family transporter [Aggregatilineales bacterium]
MRKWLAFWAVGLIWGSSFLLIRVSLGQLSPYQVVFIRTSIAAVCLNVTLLALGKRLPRTMAGWRLLLILGLFNTTLPFVLISWGQKTVDSGMASVLNATAPLFTMVAAHVAFADERITLKKIAGLVLGFLGVVLLASRSWVDGQFVPGNLLGQLAIVTAALCYGVFSTYSRGVVKTRLAPLVVSTGALTVASISSGLVILVVPLLGGQASAPLADLRFEVLAAIIVLGLFNTYVTYLMFYWVIDQLGAARASMVTYVTPAVGLTLGALVLGEVIDWRLLAGALLILAGIAVVNLRWRQLAGRARGIVGRAASA